MARPFGSENVATKQKRLIRKAMEDYVFKHREDMIERLAADPNYIRYLFDQVIGKAQEHIDFTTQGAPIFLASEIIKKHGLNTSAETDSGG